MLSTPNHVHDHLRLKLKDETTLHTVQRGQKNHFRNREFVEEITLSNIFGSQMAIRLRMEKAILSSFHRLPTLKSEFCGLESVTKRDVEMDFYDFMGDPYESETELPNLHCTMENRLGLISSKQFIN